MRGVRILVAVSALAADSVAQMAARFPWPPGTQARVITVSEPVHPAMAELIPGKSTVADVQQDAREHANAVAAGASEELSNAGVASEAMVVDGDPGKVISEEARKWDADLVVVGSHTGRVARRLIGSVSRAVVDHAPCPVLILRPKSE
jgi:nucleotide-binding universal stress UspA family protein